MSGSARVSEPRHGGQACTSLERETRLIARSLTLVISHEFSCTCTRIKLQVAMPVFMSFDICRLEIETLGLAAWQQACGMGGQLGNPSRTKSHAVMFTTTEPTKVGVHIDPRLPPEIWLLIIRFATSAPIVSPFEFAYYYEPFRPRLRNITTELVDDALRDKCANMSVCKQWYALVGDIRYEDIRIGRHIARCIPFSTGPPPNRVLALRVLQHVTASVAPSCLVPTPKSQHTTLHQSSRSSLSSHTSRCSCARL